LTPNAGLNSGFMISQYTAASIVSQNKQLCSPASVDTIDSSKGQEDHVSMGANAATKALRVIENVEKVLAIELLTAMQALDFRKEKSSEIIHQLKTRFRKKITFSAQDRLMYQDINSSLDFIKNNHPEKLF
jgi:histidine ammonia-lyase